MVGATEREVHPWLRAAGHATRVAPDAKSALRALGILPAPWWARDRLRERESGDAGFAKPPRW